MIDSVIDSSALEGALEVARHEGRWGDVARHAAELAIRARRAPAVVVPLEAGRKRRR